jgi:hypothetical protein
MKKVSFLLIAIISIFSITSCDKDCPKPLTPPVAEAGNTQFVQLPISTATLVGSGTTTNPPITAYFWNVVSGPNNPTIQSPVSATTIVSNLVAGTYKLQLRVTDQAGLTGVDTVSIIVSASPIQTLTLQPENNTTEARIVSFFPNGAGTPSPSLSVSGWTSGGAPYIGRFLLKFDYTAIATTATILSAKLSLYANTTPPEGNLIDAHFGTANSFNLSRITSTWSNTVTWNTQPSNVTTNQVTIPQSTSSFQDNIDIDVTQLVVDMRASNNYGFLGKLVAENTYNSRQYFSSTSSLPAKRPKLVITYTN